jgi:glycosyltransferase involved in cell wall biosynthesis
VSDKIREIVGAGIHHPERCVTVYDGVDLNRFAGKGNRGVIRREYNIGADEKLIGNIAAIAPHKDYETFLQTVAILSGKIKAKYLIAGDGPLRQQVEKRIAELNLQKEVFMLGFRQDLENVFADLDLLLYTSKEEGLGSTLLDAMAYGLPIVTTEAGGIPEIVKHEFNGLTSPPCDPERLAFNVERLVNDPSLCDQLTANGKQFIKTFSKERMAAQTLEIYKEVLPKEQQR